MKTDDDTLLAFLEWFGLLEEFTKEKELSGVTPSEYVETFQLGIYLEDYLKNKLN